MNTPTDKCQGMKVSVNHTCFLNVLSRVTLFTWPVPPILVRAGPWVQSCSPSKRTVSESKLLYNQIP